MAGGIILFWKGQFTIQLSGYTTQALHVHILERHRTWSLSGVYVQPHCRLKEEFWEELHSRSQHMDQPCFVIGDFNDIASVEEKCVGTEFRVNAAHKFVER